MSSLPDRMPTPLVEPIDVLAWAIDRFDRLAIATSLGPTSLGAAHLLHALGRSVPVFFLDTGLLFDETYDLRRRVEDRYGVQIRRVHPLTLEEQARRHGDALWRRNPDRCCQIRKVDPLRRALVGLDAWITGLRRDQSPARARIDTVEWDDVHGLVKLNPFAHWSRDRLFGWLRDEGVPINPLLDDGYRSVGCRPCTTRATGAGERSGRWPGRAKSECGIHHLFPKETP